MRRPLTTILTAALMIGLVAGLAPAGCGSSDGPRIEVGQNVRNLCNYTLSGTREETRCANASAEANACSAVPGTTCWQPEPDGAATCAVHADCAAEEVCYGGFCYPACDADADCTGGAANVKCVANGDADGTKACRVYGYCRECALDGQCQSGVCDNGWCHATCAVDDDCGGGELCTGGICRPPHRIDFSFNNVGGRDLKIYIDQTVVRGDADAGVFCDLEWSLGGEDEPITDPLIVSPNDSAFLAVYFRPTELGVSRAWIDIYSNDKTLSPLPLVICGEALSMECSIGHDGSCPECPSCTPDDFQGYDTKDPVCQ